MAESFFFSYLFHTKEYFLTKTLIRRSIGKKHPNAETHHSMKLIEYLLGRNRRLVAPVGGGSKKKIPQPNKHLRYGPGKKKCPATAVGLGGFGPATLTSHVVGTENFLINKLY